MTQFTPAFLESVIPTVVESDARTERSFDIFSLLLKERIVFLGTPIDDQVANLIVAQLLFLQREDPERDISLYIHSPGGVIPSGLGTPGVERIGLSEERFNTSRSSLTRGTPPLN